MSRKGKAAGVTWESRIDGRASGGHDRAALPLSADDTPMFAEFRKCGNDSSILFRSAALLVLHQKPELAFVGLRRRHQFPEASNTNHPLSRASLPSSFPPPRSG